ncbi:MAG TPA: hypothetical protein VFY39_12100 [Gammaproteobacteria bacterium]|nr:hypothetical protein [Gammaproteobacteria bacterium]
MREGWGEANVLVIAYYGTQTAAPPIEPAVRALRIALPRTRLLLLWPAPVRVPAMLGRVRVIDQRIDYPLPKISGSGKPGRAERSAAVRTVAALREAAPTGVIVFTASGRSPYLPAYLCCLAGVPKRAGFTAEFGGGVLTHPFAPPAAEVPAAERHLHLLELLGLAHRAVLAKVEPRTPPERAPQPARPDALGAHTSGARP